MKITEDPERFREEREQLIADGVQFKNHITYNGEDIPLDGSEPDSEPGPQLIIRRASDIQARRLVWLWLYRFVGGAINLILGMPDVGKSVLVCDIIGRITNDDSGWPPVNGEHADIEHGHVAILAAEDSPETTGVPRLKGAGANLERVHFIEGVNRIGEDGDRVRDSFDIAMDVRHLEALRAQIQRESGKLVAVVIDPLDSYLNAKVDTNIGNKVRAALWPLKDWAETTGVTILIVHHFNKSATTVAIDKVSGARSFGALPRSVWAVGRDPADGHRTIMAPIKLNLVKQEDKKSVAYRIESCQHDPDVPCVNWLDEPVSVTAGDIVSGKQETQKDKAADWLRDMLADGPMNATELKEHADNAGYAWRTINRAKDEAKVRVSQVRDGSRIAGWTWSLAGEN